MRSKLNITLFPERLKKQRDERGLSQQELGAKTGISTKTINTWENTDPKDGNGPKVSNIISLCEALECDFEYLFGGIDEPTNARTDIQSETGLSREAIEKLCERNNDVFLQNSGFLEILSTIIVHGFYLGTLYEEYKTAANKYDNRHEFYKLMKPKCDDIEMSKKEFYELLESDVKEAEFKIILEISKIVQRGYRNGKHKEDRGQDRDQL
ncbi:MAG: helix-turn-helix domain-containing protein [Oscillospiraceae bacterium]|nr:helix-turn-helix domain-containing protein [Oscillospiraceae bacterium]